VDEFNLAFVYDHDILLVEYRDDHPEDGYEGNGDENGTPEDPRGENGG
jgi:hypothetical protein